MWIIPANYPQSSRYALDTVASSEDLSSPGINIEQSLMWRSKPSQLRTWLQRWKRDSWFQHLSGRILKPCQHTAFETELMCSLAVIPASRSAPLGCAKAQTTPDTYGHTSTTTFAQLDLFASSLKTSKDTSALDCETSLQTWKALVTKRRGEYLARLKSARLTRESESTFWPTPVAQDDNKSPEAHMAMKQRMKGGPRYKPTSLQVMVKGVERGLWPTPTAQDNNQVSGNPDHPKRSTTLGGAVRQWPTPQARDHRQGSTPTSKRMQRKAQQKFSPNLNDSVLMWPTPTANEDAAGTPNGNMQKMLGNHPAVRGTTPAEWSAGALNPDWVEGLMGLPLGWTDLGKWGSSE